MVINSMFQYVYLGHLWQVVLATIDKGFYKYGLRYPESTTNP